MSADSKKKKTALTIFPFLIVSVILLQSQIFMFKINLPLRPTLNRNFLKLSLLFIRFFQLFLFLYPSSLLYTEDIAVVISGSVLSKLCRFPSSSDWLQFFKCSPILSFFYWFLNSMEYLRILLMWPRHLLLKSFWCFGMSWVDVYCYKFSTRTNFWFPSRYTSHNKKLFDSFFFINLTLIYSGKNFRFLVFGVCFSVILKFLKYLFIFSVIFSHLHLSKY